MQPVLTLESAPFLDGYFPHQFKPKQYRHSFVSSRSFHLAVNTLTPPKKTEAQLGAK